LGNDGFHRHDRRSITGYIVFLLGAPILWKSKAQKSVSLSSSEAEYYALSEAAKEIKFVVQILLSMGIPVKIPVIVRVDNMGAIFMSENASASSRTKHVDTRYHFVREYVEDGFIRIVFVRTANNVSDSFTKNVTGDVYDAHTKRICRGQRDLLSRLVIDAAGRVLDMRHSMTCQDITQTCHVGHRSRHHWMV
jgi:hypothetical protein